MTHNLPGFKNEPQSEYHFFKCFLLCCAVSMTVNSKPRTDLNFATARRRGCCQIEKSLQPSSACKELCG